MATTTSPMQGTTYHSTQWALLILRLFLGITFVYAGIQKLTDPQFFRATAPGYFGHQIASYALHSPLRGFLTQVVEPHALIFGLFVSYAEIAIGFGILFGFLFRPAAFFGLLLNIILFLTATWRVYPYFYGSDIVFAFCWLVLLVNGPQNTGLPTFDEMLTADLFAVPQPTRQQQRLASVLRVVLGVDGQKPASTVEMMEKQAGTRSRASAKLRAAQVQTRRSFVSGLLTGGIGAIGLVGLAAVLRIIPIGSNSATAGAASPGAATSGAANATAAATDAAAAGNTPAAATANVIAQVSAVQNNSAVTFTIPATGDPGVLVRLDNGQFVAYDATCTHAGCEVGYDPSQKLLECPCHGAAFDPAKQGAAVQAPADTPLTAVPIRVDGATGSIVLAG